MNRFLFRFLLLLTLCGILGVDSQTKAQVIVPENSGKESRIERHDSQALDLLEERQRPILPAFRQSPPLHRVSSTRPSRIMPTYGGKNGRSMGVRKITSSFHFHFYACWVRCLRCQQLMARTLSPRDYYVIALRHLLC